MKKKTKPKTLLWKGWVIVDKDEVMMHANNLKQAKNWLMVFPGEIFKAETRIVK